MLGIASGSLISNGGTQFVSAGGTAIGTLLRLSSGGGLVTDNQVVGVSGVALGTIIRVGEQDVLSGGTVSGVTNSGGFQEIFSGAVVIGVKVEDFGGIETLESAAVVSGTLVDRGVQFVESGSTAIATKVISGSQIVLLSGGGHGALAVSATIGPHGDQSVAIGGTALDTTLFGEADIQSGGTAIGMTVKSGGLLLVDDGGTASGVVSSGGALALFGSNPSVAGVTLLTGAILELGGGHVGSGDVSRGFPEKVLNGGTQAGGAILSGGRVDVLFLGIASGTTVSSGGKIVVSNAGQAIDMTILHGGTGIVSAGGIFLADAGGTAEIDGRLTLNAAGELFASGAGGLIDIASGGFVSGGSTVIGDGTVAIHASGNTEKVVFEPDGSGGLILDDRAGHAAAYAGRVSGFGGDSHTNTSQFIDLELVTFSAGKIGSSYTPVNASSGTLTVTSGGTVVAKIAFAGQYVASDFHVTSDATGHVLITDPGVPFGGGATLGFAADGNQHGGILPITLGTAATAALFGHYIAGSLLAGAGACG